MRNEIRTVIREYVNDNDFEDDENLFQLGYVDSLFVMEMVAFIEKKYSIIVPRENINADHFSSIDAIINLIDKEQAPYLL